MGYFSGPPAHQPDDQACGKTQLSRTPWLKALSLKSFWAISHSPVLKPHCWSRVIRLLSRD